MIFKKLYTIIINHNGRKYLKDCLESLMGVKVDGFKHQIFLIDNASWDNSVAYVKKRFPQFKIRRNHQNLGFTGGANLGLQIALKHKAKYILLLNHDTLVTSNFLQTLLDFAEKKEKVGIVSPLIVTPGKRPKIWFAGGVIDPVRFSAGHVSLGEKVNRRLKKPFETEFTSGCAMLIKRQVIEKIGLFDDRFFLYYEDVDFSLRAQKAGFKCIVVPEAKIVHRKIQSEIGDQKEYYLARNHLLLMEKHASPKVKLGEFARIPKTIWEYYQRKNDPKAEYALLGIKDYFLRRFGKREHWY